MDNFDEPFDSYLTAWDDSHKSTIPEEQWEYDPVEAEFYDDTDYRVQCDHERMIDF